MTKRVLFSGYAPVHFVCFRPIYRKLTRSTGLQVFLSGESRDSYGGAEDLYRRFGIRPDRILPLSKMQRRSFDMTICAHTSGYFPCSERDRVQMFHGLSFRNVAVRRDVLVFDHLFITGPYMRRLFVSGKLLRRSDPRLIDIGFPKLDRLVDGSLDRRRMLHRLRFSGRRPVVLYAPTGQKYNSLETGVGEAVLERLQRRNRYDIIIKLHDHPRTKTDWKRRLKSFIGPHVRLVADYDVVPYLYVADLLITDASSVSNEYSLMDRPMVFIDVPELLDAARAKRQSVDLDTWGRRGGKTARWPDDVADAVEWSLAHPSADAEIRQAMARDLFYDPGGATDRAVSWIRSRLGLRLRAVGTSLAASSG